MIYDKASLVQIPSGYKSGTLYSVVPNTADGDFTVTGDPQGEATRVNKDGLIETVSADVPRLNYNFIDGVVQPDPHLLLEPSRTNLFINSNSFVSSNWFKSNATVTANQAISPTGANDASLLTATADNGLLAEFNEWTSTQRTASFFAKKNTSSVVEILNTSATTNFVRYDLESGSVLSEGGTMTGEIQDFGNGWYRVIATYSIASGTNTFGFRITNAGSVYISRAQIEEGSYPTSYIPTSGSAVTRTEDFCYINSGLQNILNTSEGTLFVDVEVPRVSSINSFERIVLSDQNASTDRIIFDNYGGNWRALMLSTAGNVNKTIVGVTANQRIKVAIAYSSTQLRVSYDGNAATTTSGSYTPSTTLESFKFSNKDGGNKWQGKIYQTMVFNKALSDSELETLTSYTSFNQMAKALLYTIE